MDLWGAITIPPDRVKVGPVELRDQLVGWTEYGCGEPGAEWDTCSWGGDSLGGFTSMLEIVRIDATSITVNLGTISWFGGGGTSGPPAVVYPPVNLQGTYTLPFCDPPSDAGR